MWEVADGGSAQLPVLAAVVGCRDRVPAANVPEHGVTDRDRWVPGQLDVIVAQWRPLSCVAYVWLVRPPLVVAVAYAVRELPATMLIVAAFGAGWAAVGVSVLPNAAPRMTVYVQDPPIAQWLPIAQALPPATATGVVYGDWPPVRCAGAHEAPPAAGIESQL